MKRSFFCLALCAAAQANAQQVVIVNAPTPPPTVIVEAPREVELNFVGDDGLTLMQRRDRRISGLCTAPCTARVIPGMLQLGLQTDDGSLAMSVVGTSISSDTAIRGRFESFAERRTIGWIIGGSALLVGGGAALYGLFHRGDVGLEMGITGTGLALAGIGVVTGLILIAKSDEARLELVPNGLRATF